MAQNQINQLQMLTFGKFITRPEAIEPIPANNLMAMLQAGQWRKPIEAIRKEKNPILQKEMKQRLPYFVYGVLSGARSEENVRQVNGIVFDFDHVGDYIEAKQKLMDAAPWFRWLFRSPVDGLKLMIPFSRPVTDKAEYLMIWTLLRDQIANRSGLTADNTPDLCRACFVSWDDDVITCPEEWLVDLDEWLREFNTESQRRRDGEKQGKGEKVADGVGRKVDVPVNQITGATDKGTGATDVPVGQGPQGLSGPKDKPLRGFANGDVCGSCNTGDVCGSSYSPDEVQAKSAVEYLAQRKLDRREWIRCGIALFNHFGEDGIVYWLQFAYNPNYSDTPEDLRKVWERLKKYPGVGLGTLFYIAEQNGWINAVQSSGGRTETPAPTPSLHPAANCHSGEVAPATGAPESRQCGNSQCDTEAGPMQAAPGSSPCQGITRKGWIPGPLPHLTNSLRSSARTPLPRNDSKPGSSDENAQDTETPFHPSNPSIRANSCNSWTDKTLADFPELLELFRRPQNIPLDRAQLPPEIVDYLNLVGRITDAQDGAKLTAFLPVVAANIGNKVFMYNAGTKHFCNIWAAIIGPSTVSRKTTVINQAMKMLQPFKDSLVELSPKERNEQDIELSRVTQARLYNLLAINPNRLILQMELSAWMREMGKSYNAGMKQEITDMFDGKDRSIAKMEIDEYIRRPAFSIVGATTEDWFFQELREVADQRGGFLQRFIICIIQNIDVNELRLESVDASDCDRELADWDEMLAVFRSLPDSRRLQASDEASAYRNAIYSDLIKAIALNANDPQAAYCARIFDNYFWRFCILIFLLKNWRDLREAMANDHLQTWFMHNKVDLQTAKEAWYLCQYYYENTRPFLKQLTEGSKLDEERKILRLLQKSPEQDMTHSRLLNKSRMTSRDFRNCIQSLIERQAIICHEHKATNNKVALEYTLNPVLAEIDIS